MFLVLSGVATGEEAARRKTKKKKEQYHASQRDPRQAEELRDPLSEELQSLLNNALDFANRAHHEEALFLAQRALAIDSANAKATYIVGLVHLNKAQSELALKYLNGAVEKDPNNPTYLNALGNSSARPSPVYPSHEDDCNQVMPTCRRQSIIMRWRRMSPPSILPPIH